MVFDLLRQSCRSSFQVSYVDIDLAPKFPPEKAPNEDSDYEKFPRSVKSEEFTSRQEFSKLVCQLRDAEQRDDYMDAHHVLSQALLGNQPLADVHQDNRSSDDADQDDSDSTDEGVDKSSQLLQPCRSGWLWISCTPSNKAGKAKRWKRRYCMLGNNAMRGFKSDKSISKQPQFKWELAKGELTTHTIQGTITETPHVFHVVTTSNTYHFCAQSEDEASAWMHAISLVLSPPELNGHKVTIAPRSNFMLPVRVSIPGTILVWSFHVEAKDIGFSVSFRESGGSLSGAAHTPAVPETVVTWSRHAREVHGQHKVLRDGVYILCWDNTYSVATPKHLTYRVSKLVHSPTNNKYS